jgi:hypothetical protein
MLQSEVPPLQAPMYTGSAVCPKLYNPECFLASTMEEYPGGTGKERRSAANACGIDSKVTAGMPNVMPTSEATRPPKECPVTQTLALGYISVMLP